MYRSIIIILLILPVFAFAQQSGPNTKQIYIAKSYTEQGKPIGEVHRKKVELDKTYGIIFSNGNKDFKEHLVFLNIEKAGATTPQFNKLIRTEKGKSFVAFNYTFSGEGDYIIYFTDFSKKKIASLSITVKPEVKNKPEKASIGESRPSIGIIFSKKIIGNNPVDIVKSPSLYNDGGEVYFFISDIKPLGVNQLSIGIWKKKYNLDYDQFVESKKFNVNPDWYDTYFKYRFISSGEFKIVIYDENEILLKTAYISVQK